MPLIDLKPTYSLPIFSTVSILNTNPFHIPQFFLIKKYSSPSLLLLSSKVVTSAIPNYFEFLHLFWFTTNFFCSNFLYSKKKSLLHVELKDGFFNLTSRNRVIEVSHYLSNLTILLYFYQGYKLKSAVF